MQSLSDLKGVGPQMLLHLHQNQITTAHRLVLRAPIRYAVFRIDNPNPAKPEETYTLEGTLLENTKVQYLRRNLNKLTVKIRFDHREATLVLFNRPYLKTAFQNGTVVVATGKFDERLRTFTASDAWLKRSFREGIVPLYGLEGISDKVFFKLVMNAKASFVPDEILPLSIIGTKDILPISDYLSILHEPKQIKDIEMALRRTKYEELLAFAMEVLTRKRKWESLTRERVKIPIEGVRSFIRTLPFELTDEQKQCVNDIYRDFATSKPMNRLLQGDVGSGKTMVALIACFGVLSIGEQVAFMAPTEVLAKQHHALFSKLLRPFGIPVHYLSGSIRGEARDAIFCALQQGAALVVGTHALFQESVTFSNLGLIVIDEQHRFGVRQRQELVQKALLPDRLYLSATPIPRTLAIALFADMDVSTIRTLPSGRRPVKTMAISFEGVPMMVEALKARLREGRQAYVIVPVVGQTGSTEWSNVLETARWLEGEWSEGTVGFLHGKMPSDEKIAVLERFARHEIDLLVATTVVEVGVDVPNASVMAVLHAERFGLSQLHQIRGRIGRGGYDGECYLVSDVLETEPERFQILVESRDGFRIAEEDLRLRGPGHFLGTDQSGLPPFRTANFIEDRELLNSVFLDAKRIVESDDPTALRYRESRKNAPVSLESERSMIY